MAVRTKAKPKKQGRKKGSRNRGYFYRTGRGWYTKDGSRFIPLTYDDGERIRERDADEEDVKQPYARWLLAKKERAKARAASQGERDATVLDVCTAYTDPLWDAA